MPIYLVLNCPVPTHLVSTCPIPKYLGSTILKYSCKFAPEGKKHKFSLNVQSVKKTIFSTIISGTKVFFWIYYILVIIQIKHVDTRKTAQKH